MAAGARDDRRAAPRVDAKAVRATRRAASPSIRCFVSGAQRSSASLHTGEAERQSKRSCSPQPIQAVAPPPKALGSHGLPKKPSPRSSAPGPGAKRVCVFVTNASSVLFGNCGVSFPTGLSLVHRTYRGRSGAGAGSLTRLKLIGSPVARHQTKGGPFRQLRLAKQPSLNPEGRARSLVSQLEQRRLHADRCEADDEVGLPVVCDGISNQHCRSSPLRTPVLTQSRDALRGFNSPKVLFAARSPTLKTSARRTDVMSAGRLSRGERSCGGRPAQAVIMLLRLSELAQSQPCDLRGDTLPSPQRNRCGAFGGPPQTGRLFTGPS